MPVKVELVKRYYDKRNPSNTEEVNGYITVTSTDDEERAVAIVAHEISVGNINTSSSEIEWDEIYMPEDIRVYEDWSFDTTCVVFDVDDETLVLVK